MKTSRKENNGFSLVELMVVVTILAVVMGGVFSLYSTHLKNAYKQDENLDVQQNLRLAMDTISRDLKMAGMLVPITVTPLFNSSTALGNYSSSLIMNVSSPDGIYARVQWKDNRISKTTVGPFANLSTQVDSPQAVDAFLSANKPTDRIRIISPFDNSLTFANSTTFVLDTAPTNSCTDRNAQRICVKRGVGGTIASGITLSAGNVIAKGASNALYDTVTYTLAAGTGVSPGNGCPTGQSCLFRSINGALPGDVVAGNISSLRFSYILNDNRELKTPALSDVSTIKSVRVTLNGVSASAKTANEIAQKTRQITSVIALRNRRSN